MPDLEDLKFELKRVLLSDAFRTYIDQQWDEKEQLYGNFYRLAKYYPTAVFGTQLMEISQTFPYIELNTPISRNMQQQSPPIVDLQHEVQIFWHDRHDQEEELDLRLIRYLTATRRFFEANMYLGNLGNAPITQNDDVYSPFVPVNMYNARPFVKSGMLTIYVRLFTDVPENR